MSGHASKRLYWVLPVVIALTGWACAKDSAAPTGPSLVLASAEPPVALGAAERRVWGSGLIRAMEGLEYRNAIEARLLSDGTAVGKVTVNIVDLTAYGDDKNYVVLNAIDCLEFDGQTVWFGGSITHTTLPGASVGDRTLGVIVDQPDGDLASSGPAQFYGPPGTTCHDRPVLPTMTVVDGGFTVR
jgi:hypothetical protein